jgi:hypothetical protein
LRIAAFARVEHRVVWAERRFSEVSLRFTQVGHCFARVEHCFSGAFAFALPAGFSR